MSNHLISYIILALYVVNCAWYISAGDWGRGAYWFFAAGIMVSATWLIKF